jgi:myo-inositol catabolism protein IolC
LSVASAALAAAQALHRRDSDQLADLQEDLKARLEDLAAERDATKQQVGPFRFVCSVATPFERRSRVLCVFG